MRNATAGMSDLEAVEALRLNVQACNKVRCTEARVSCVAGVHLFPDALSADLYPVYVSPSGSAAHSESTCAPLRGAGRLTHRDWPSLSGSMCRQCGKNPEAIAKAAAEARKVSSALGTISAASRSWPGRLNESGLRDVAAAEQKLAKVRAVLLRDQVELGIRVAGILLRDTSSWAPPQVPVEIIGAAAAELVGVEDDPFFRSGQRPRTSADRAAADVMPAATLDRLWSTWHAAVTKDGLDAPMGPVVRSGLHRASQATAAQALVGEWVAAARNLADAGELRVVAIPATATNGARPGTAAGHRAALIPLAAANVAAAGACLVVVPDVVARWLAREPLNIFENVGAWPSDVDDAAAVAALETLVRLSEGALERMADLLPVAVDLATDAA